MLRSDSKLYLYSEVADTMLPGKVSKLQLHRNRTRNRHRWSGRVDQGAWENSAEGTRQNGTVTSGEGTLLTVMTLAVWAIGSHRNQAAATVY